MQLQDKMEVELRADVFNLGEPAYEAHLILNIDPAFTYVGRNDVNGKNGSLVHCDLVNATMLDCDLGNPYPQVRD